MLLCLNNSELTEEPPNASLKVKLAPKSASNSKIKSKVVPNAGSCSKSNTKSNKNKVIYGGLGERHDKRQCRVATGPLIIDGDGFKGVGGE